jgi:cysteine-rich repeat protein
MGSTVGPAPPDTVAAGEVNTIAIDPHNPMTLYAGTECAGILKTLDGGDTWAPANDGLPVNLTGDFPPRNVTWLAVDPVTPNTVYASIAGGYLFKSADAARTWSNDQIGPPGHFASALAFDPRTAGTLYAATDGPLFKSTNGAQTWSAVGTGYFVAADPFKPNTVYAARIREGIFVSTDGGDTWRALAPLPDSVSVFPLAVDPVTPGIIYAASYDNDKTVVWKSTDAGASWHSTELSSRGNPPVIVIDPVNPGTLYVGINSRGVLDGDSHPEVMKSTDGGTTWHLMSTGLGYPSAVAGIAIDPSNPATVYAALTPSGPSLGGSLFKSTDGALTWQSIGLGPRSICGDGVRTCYEPCDDGNLVSGDGCDANCTLTACGNGIATAGEECDDGNGDPADGCTNNCTICGNGRATPPEECDDGNTNPADGCTNACTICGNGTVTFPEECDDHNLANGDGCDANCTRTRCGNGIVTTGEECDDGNLNDGDGCDHNCTLPRCGNGIVDAGEECDDGNLINGDGCAANCTRATCGNGIIEAGEQCDDGNDRSCDGCSATCQIEAGCGDGTLDALCGEECDDGNTVNGDGCDANCTLPRCGNGIVDAGEQCDDGNRDPFDGCTNNCTICGNGIVTPPEECDDGNTNPADGCTNACTRCGNGVTTPPESCDDGNLANGDGCDADCVVPSVCGNGRVDAGEECDDGGACTGSANAGDFCTADGQCPGGMCQTFGGDGCAANCTSESDVVFTLFRGLTPEPWLEPGASGTWVYGENLAVRAPLAIGVPLSGSQTLTIGKERDGQIPVVIKEATIHVPRVALFPSGCFCSRPVAAKTCGGTVFEGDSTDCTPGITAGDSLCQGRQPCAFSYGPGNFASGTIGCDGLQGVDASLRQDAGGRNGIALPPQLTLRGAGGAGSAVLLATMTLGTVIHGQCAGTDPSIYGPDELFCTDDDPPAWRGAPVTGAVTTGTVTGHVLNANLTDRDDIGPFTVTGAPFGCEALQHGDASGAVLASVFTELNRPEGGDFVFTSSLVASRSADPCIGDCDGSGEVTVNEIITLVNIALGEAHPSACSRGVPAGTTVDVSLIIRAVNNALNGCGTD